MTEGNTSMYMPVAPAYGNGGGFGFGGDSGAWWLLILLFAIGGWGNGFGGGFGGNGMAPMMVNNDVQRGFDQSALVSGITGVQNSVVSGFGDVQNALCGGFAGVNSNIANGFAQTEIAANGRQMADMNRSFDSQVATMQGFNGVQAQLSNCCCENRLATAQQTSTILAEHCADRQVLSDGVRDILASQSANTQRILDVMCQNKLDDKNEKILDLERQITALNNQNYIQNALTAQTQYFLSLYPTTTGGGAAGAARAVAVA